MGLDTRVLTGVGVLAAVTEAGSFVRAAETLGLTPSGVSRAVARLEGRVGVRLFDRTPRSVTLTEEGRRFYTKVVPIHADQTHRLRVWRAGDEAGAGATPPLRCRSPTRVRRLQDAYRAGRNPTAVSGHADEEQWVGTCRHTSHIPNELSISFRAERNRRRIQDSLSRCAGVTHQRAFHACYRAWRAAGIPAIQDEPLDIDSNLACLEVDPGVTSSGCPRQSATGNPGYGI